MLKTCLSILIFSFLISTLHAQRLRDYEIEIGIFKPGQHNAITDVPGVQVGHTTLISADSIRTGVTAIIPAPGNIFQQKLPAAMYLGNGFGKLAGYSQVKELGNIETPVILTNTLSVPIACNALLTYTLGLPGNENVYSVNPVVGETNDGNLNDIRGRHVREEHILQAIQNSKNGPVAEGNVGAGTGTRCFSFKGGIGTASRKLPESLGGYTIGILTQTNFGGELIIAGVPIAKEMENFPFHDKVVDGSCMIVLVTDAPIDSRNLERLAKRAMMGLARTGGWASNGSGDYVIAISNAESLRIPYQSDSSLQTISLLRNGYMTPLFAAAIEATEEAIINSLFAAETMTGRNGNTAKALPVEEVLGIMKKYGRFND